MPDGVGAADVVDEHSWQPPPQVIHCHLSNDPAETLAESHHVVHRVYEEMYRPCEELRQLAVSCDGTWKRLSFQSLIGVGFVIEMLTGLFLDYALLCKYCIDCELVGKKLSG